MGPLLAFSRAVDEINHRTGILADYMVLFACLVSAGNATSRYLFNASGNAWLELQWQMFSIIVLLGASYTLRRNEHVRVDILYSWVSDRTRLWIDVLGHIFFLLPATIILTYLSWRYFLTSAPPAAAFSAFRESLSGGLGSAFDGFIALLRSGEQSGNAGGLPAWPVKILLPIGFFLLSLQGLSELVKRVAALLGRIVIDSHYEKPLQ